MNPTSSGNKYSMLIDQVFRFIFVLLTCFIGLLAYEGRSMLIMLNDHERRIGNLESSGYSIREAYADNNTIKAEILDLRVWIEKNYPPSYLLEDVKDLKADVRLLRETISQMRATLLALTKATYSKQDGTVIEGP